MSTGTVRLHRVISAPAERIYRAFLDPDSIAKWLPPDGFTGRVHQMDAKVGGKWRMSFTNFGSGIPAVIPLEACYLGWQQSLVLLAKLVEAEIPG